MADRDLRFHLNGTERTARVPARIRLVDLLRDDLGVSSIHVGCDQGACGSCTVLLNGQAVRSCVVLAPQVQGQSVTTLEGLRDTAEMMHLRHAFAAHRALQCGFCTPGLLVAAHALLRSDRPVSPGQVESLVDDHLCRCTGYASITDALHETVDRLAARRPADPDHRHTDHAGLVAGRRVEVEALLNGDATFVSETRMDEMAHASILRSPHASATIAAMDIAAACAMPGVLAVMTAEDLQDIPELPQVMPHPLLSSRSPRALAGRCVRYVGEPVCLVVATTQAAADDAVERVEVSWQVGEAVLEVERACVAGAPRVHDDLEGNVAARLHQKVGDVDAGFGAAPCVVRERFQLSRLAAQSLEPRAITASYGGGRLTVRLSTQSPHSAKKILAQQTGLPAEAIRVIAPRAGGGFGFKNRYYPEYTAVALAAMRLGRPIRWVESRAESFTASYHAGEQSHEASLAVSADGTIRAVCDAFLYDQGAYTPLGVVVPWITSVSIPGPYRVPAYEVRASVVLTNKTPASFYRGAGKPQATFVMERLLDLAADRLKIDRLEVRRRNLLTPADFPYRTGLADIDEREIVYDSGSLPRCLDEVGRRLEYDRFAEEQVRARAEGRRVGRGVACYMEKSGLGPFEGARVAMASDGTVEAWSGISTQGQGHEEMFARLCADRLGVPMERVRVTLGDTDTIAQGIGTYCARGAVMAGNAVVQAAERVRDRLLVAASELLKVPADAIALDARGIVTRTGLRLAPVSSVARYVSENLPRFPLDGEVGPGLDATVLFRSDRPVFASGAYGVVVEVDPDVGHVRILRHCIVHDCGVALNPEAVDQQLTGGLLYGIGRALTERLEYDASGRPATADYGTYALPRASDVPPPLIGHVETPSPFNPLGVKGVGEAGAIPVGAAVAAAVEDAVGHAVGIRSLPVDARSILGMASLPTRSQVTAAGEYT